MAIGDGTGMGDMWTNVLRVPSGPGKHSNSVDRKEFRS